MPIVSIIKPHISLAYMYNDANELSYEWLSFFVLH